MKNLLASVTTLTVMILHASIPPLRAAQENASMSLHCVSLRFYPATAKSLGINYTFSLMTGAGNLGVGNGELAPDFSGGPTTHACRFQLDADFIGVPITGFFALDVPTTGDTNRNHINDFFEPDLPVDAVSTTGAFMDDLTSEVGTVNATWARSAGSASGTCQMKMQSSYLMQTFNFTFDLLEYQGLLQYTPSSGSVTGLVNVADYTNVTNRWLGPLMLSIVDSNNLRLIAGSWTNLSGQVLSNLDTLSGESIQRGGTNYVGFVDFADGDLSTSESDYATWLLVISDGNDANGNGIPDLSDTAVARAPQLSLSISQQQLYITISGAVGLGHTIEQNTSLDPANWKTAYSLILTNDPQTVALPWPTNSISFYRAWSGK